MAGLVLTLLGPFQAARDGKPPGTGQQYPAFATDAARALLAYLAADRAAGTSYAPHRREMLAGLLWPEVPDRQAMQNLRQALHYLRRGLGDTEADPPFLLVSHESIQLDPAADCRVDVAVFDEAIAATRAHRHRRLEACPSCIARLRQAAELYRGDFMAGFSLPSAPFEQWLLARRESLRLQALDVLQVLALYHERRGEHEQALHYARRQLELEPWRETAHRQCMRALALRGERTTSLAQYEVCRRVLEEELGVEPEQETRTLYEHIRGATTEPVASAVARHNLPAQLTPFVGRERELAQIGEWLADSDGRLLTLVGPGGSGKTRLALQAAGEQAYGFQHGVFWASLAAVESAAGMVAAIAQALELIFHAGVDPGQQLLRYLRDKELLLVLDNLEHLLPEIGLLAALLNAAPDVQVLATSRARLSLQGEQVLLVGGMEYPELVGAQHAAHLQDETRQYSAVILFLHAARRVHSSYEPTTDDLAQVAHICRLVEGMPLAILLAAAWVDALSVGQIADQVAQGLGFLAAELRDLPQCQHSMRAVFDSSWRLLSEQEHEVFAALSVFLGGFTAEAAEAVAGADLRTLAGLVRKSFLQLDSMGRYTAHELLRQYGEEKLDQSSDVGQATHERHAAYYAGAAVRWEAGLKGTRGHEVLAEMAAEIHNAEAAWQWLSEQGDATRLGQMIHAMGQFYAARGWYQQGEASFAMATDRLLPSDQAAATPDAAALRMYPSSMYPSSLHVQGRLLTWRGRNAFLSGHRAWAAELLRQAQAALDEAEHGSEDVRAARAWALHSLWEQLADVDRAGCRPLAEQSLALYREVDDPWGIVCVLSDLGISSWFDGAYPLAQQVFEERLALSQRWGIGEGIGVDSSLRFLSLIAALQGEVERAEHMARVCTAPLLISHDRMLRAFGLYVLGNVMRNSGQYVAAEPLLEEGMALLRELGADVLLYRLLVDQVSTKLHLGQYERARELGQEEVKRARQMEAWFFVGLALTRLAQVSVVAGAYIEAARMLEESMAMLQRAGARAHLGQALGVHAHVARGLGQAGQAWECVGQALRLGVECRAIHPLLLALSVAALLLADRGQAEQAVELYTLAWRHPVVSNSRWDEEVAGRELATVAAALPPEVREKAQARGRARDLWATAQELLDELGG